LLASVNLHPLDLALTAVGFLHRCIKHSYSSTPDVWTGAIAFDERNDRLIGHRKLAVLNGDLFPLRGHVQLDRSRHRRNSERRERTWGANASTPYPQRP